MTEPLHYNREPPRPAWGVRVAPRKAAAMLQPIVTAPLPARVRLALDLDSQRPARPLVAPGDAVLTGQPIGSPATGDGNTLCASISGRVRAIQACAIPGLDGRLGQCVVIDSDGEDQHHFSFAPPGDPHRFTPRRLRERIARAGIVGLGGALFPTAEKLGGTAVVELLILNGAECEPYISCDEMLMRERAEDIIDGAHILLRALDCQRAVIAVESDMPAARRALREVLDRTGDAQIDTAVVTAKYPAGGERQLVELLTGREVPVSGLPRDVGMVVQNVATAAAVSGLFRTGAPLISRIVTVTGGGVVNPVNVEARLGAPLADLVAAAGGYATAARELVMGGPMMGVALAGDALPVTQATNCLLVAAPGELADSPREFPCIRCAECSRVCPARLLPQELLRACDTDNPDRLERLHLDACIECGCCDYVCPSQIALTPRFSRAKTAQQARRARRREAARAGQRAEARSARLAAAREQLADGPPPGAGDPALQALLARLHDDKAPRNGD